MVFRVGRGTGVLVTLRSVVETLWVAAGVVAAWCVSGARVCVVCEGRCDASAR